jgi:hypothetical protein
LLQKVIKEIRSIKKEDAFIIIIEHNLSLEKNTFKLKEEKLMIKK